MEQTIFRLKGNKTPLTFTLNGGHNGKVTTIPKKGKHEGKKMAIRHVPSEDTIFITDQSSFAKSNAEGPLFKKGYLFAENSNVSTIDYLRAHPLFNKEYEEVNPVKIAEKSIERNELVTELNYEVMEKGKLPDGKDYLQAIVCVLTGSYIKARSLSIEELKKELYGFIEMDPYKHVDEYHNSILFGAENMKRYIIHHSMNTNQIKVSENKKSWIWCTTAALISNIPNGIMPIDHFCEFLDTDEGMIVMRKLHDLSGDIVGAKKEEVKKKPGRPSKSGE